MYKSALLSFVICCASGLVKAADYCPPPPIVSANDIDVKAEASAGLGGLLKALTGKADVSQKAEDILSKYPNADKLLARISVLRTDCEWIQHDDTLTPKQRREEYMKDYREIFGLGDSQSSLMQNLIVPVQYREPGVSSFSRTSGSGLLKMIEQKEVWQEKWFRRAPSGDPDVDGKHWNVIVGSPCGKVEAVRQLDLFNAKYPDIYFELWKTFNRCNYALTVGAGLSAEAAARLEEVVQARGMTPFLWHGKFKPAL